MSLDLHRRTLLASALVASTVFRARPAHAAPGPDLVHPTQIRSIGGVLQAQLTAAPGEIRLGAVMLPGLIYNHSYLPPLLRAQLGDVLRINLKNDLPDEPSNLHFHGMGVSPQGNGDNVFIHVHPGQAFDYEVKIPANGRQSPGLYWYHPHVHGDVAPQIMGGMSGALVVDGFDEYFPILKDLPERFLLIKHVEHSDGELISINGQVDPTVSIRPGEAQFWRIAHIGTSLFIKLHFSGVVLYVVATDGHARAQPKPVTQLFIGPGERLDAIVIGPPVGEYPVGTIPFQNQSWKLPDPAQQIATVVSSGEVTSPMRPGDVTALQLKGTRWIDEIRKAQIAVHRTISYSKTEDRQKFMIDGRVMDENRIDQTARLGDTEEWTIINEDQQYHSFHIHQTAFMVTEVSGVPLKEDSLHDTFSVPPATDIGPSSVKVIIPFTDPVIVGKFVYHCHAVDHEDKGMMGIIEVVV